MHNIRELFSTGFSTRFLCGALPVHLGSRAPSCQTGLVAPKVLGVLAGGDFPDNYLGGLAALADVVYAADSAADRLVKLGFSPIVTGDLDSVSPEALAVCQRVVRDADPDKTDCDKLLALIAADGHASAILTGLEGDLLDHMLASLSSAAMSPLDLLLVNRRTTGLFVRAGVPIETDDLFGRRVSLIPLSRCSGVILRGVVWELEEAVLEPGGSLSVSNEGTGKVFAHIRSGVALLLWERVPPDDWQW